MSNPVIADHKAWVFLIVEGRKGDLLTIIFAKIHFFLTLNECCFIDNHTTSPFYMQNPRPNNYDVSEGYFKKKNIIAFRDVIIIWTSKIHEFTNVF